MASAASGMLVPPGSLSLYGSNTALYLYLYVYVYLCVYVYFLFVTANMRTCRILKIWERTLSMCTLKFPSSKKAFISLCPEVIWLLLRGH